MYIQKALGMVNVRIPDELKARMANLPHLDWSEVIREAIEKRIVLEKRKSKDREKILEASKTQDRIADRLAGRYPKPWKGTEVIRYWREHRYSSLTRR